MKNAARFLLTLLLGIALVPAAVVDRARSMPGTGAPSPPVATVKESSGTAQLSISVAVLPGPGGLQPALALRYSSERGDSPQGVGWALSGLGAIRCSARFGTPDYSRSTTTEPCTQYELDGQLLVGPDDEGFFHTLVESFARIEFLSASDEWKVTRTDGRILTYGTSGRRILAGAHTAKWYLSEIRDPYDQSIGISYSALGDVGILYPTQIRYGVRTIDLLYEDRVDPQYDFQAGLERSLSKRLKEIRSLVNSEDIYQRLLLGYDPHPDESGSGTTYRTTRTRLRWVQRFGTDCAAHLDPLTQCTGPGLRLPRQAFEYRDSGAVASAWTPAPEWETPFEQSWYIPYPGGAQFYSDRTQIGDVNGDGLPDLISDPSIETPAQYQNGTIIHPAVYLNNGAGFDPPDWEAGNASAQYTDALRALTFGAPRLQVTMVETPGNWGHLGVSAVVASTTESETIQFGFEFSEVNGPPYTLTDNSYSDTPFTAEISAHSWFRLLDLDADGLADLVMSVRLAGITVAYDANGSLISSPTIEGGQTLRVVFRNTGDPAAPWVEDPDLANGLPVFGIIAPESLATTWQELAVPAGITEQYWDHVSTPPGWWPNTDSCGTVGLGGNRYGENPEDEMWRDFCVGQIDLQPSFVDLNGDGYLDIVALKADDEDALLFGYNVLTTHRYSPVSSRAWLQDPDAAPGEPRWVEKSEFAPPFQHVYLFGLLVGERFKSAGNLSQGWSASVPNDVGVRFADLNGDGLTDLLWTDPYHENPINLPEGQYQQNGPDYPIGALLNRGWDSDGTGSVWCSSQALGTRDSRTQSTPTGISVCEDADKYHMPATQPFTMARGLWTDTLAVHLFDVNGDGWADLVRSEWDSIGSQDPAEPLATWIHQPSLSNVWSPPDVATGFAPPESMESLLTDGWLRATSKGGVMWADVNGDGAVDFLSDTHPHTSYLGAAVFSDLLREYTNGHGATFFINYTSGPQQRDGVPVLGLEAKATTHWEDPSIDEPLVPDGAEIVRWTTRAVVESVAIDAPNFTEPALTSYRYAHPRWNREFRSNLGFRVVERTQPDQSSVNLSYYQNLGRSGALSRQSTWKNGEPLEFHEQKWELPDPSAIPGAWDGVRIGRVVERLTRTEYGETLGTSVGSVNTTSIEYDDESGYNFVSRVTSIRPSGTLMTVRVPTTDDAYYLKVLLANEKSFDTDESGRLLRESQYEYTDAFEVSTRGRVGLRRDLIQDRENPGAEDWRETRFGYDSYGNLRTRTEYAETSAGDRIINLCYDGDPGTDCPSGHGSHSLLVGIQDALGYWTRIFPDARSSKPYRIESDYSDQPTREWDYDSFGRVVDTYVYESSTQIHLASTDYDDFASPTPRVESWQYTDASGMDFVWRATVEDGLGGLWKSISAVDGGLYSGNASHLDPANSIRRATYEIACGTDELCASLTGLEDPAVVTQIDSLGRAERVTTPDGFSVHHYDADVTTGVSADAVFEKNPRGALSRRIVDGDRNLASEECDNSPDPSIQTLEGASCDTPDRTEYAYEPTGEISDIFDAYTVAADDYSDPNHTVSYLFDTLSRPISIADPNAGTSTSTYDHWDNVRTTTDARGINRTHYYDLTDRIKSIVTPEGEKTAFFYYKNDSRQSTRNSVGTTRKEFVYDALGRVEEATYLASGILLTRKFEYDLLGRETLLEYPIQSPEVSKTRYEYEGGFLKSVCDLQTGTTCADAAQSYASNATYSDVGRLTSFDMPGGTRTFEYDEATRRETRDHFESGPHSDYEIDFLYKTQGGSPHYDEVGNLLQIEGSSSIASPKFRAIYTYDERNRLETWTREGVGEVPVPYEYDELGNLTDHAGEIQTYSMAVRPHAILTRGAAPNAYTYSYDASGNVVSIEKEGSGGDRYYHYDSLNRLFCAGRSPQDCSQSRTRYAGDGERMQEWSEGEGFHWAGSDFRHLAHALAENRQSWIEIHAFGERIAYKHIVGGSQASIPGTFVEIPPIAWPGIAGGLLILMVVSLAGSQVVVVVARRPISVGLIVLLSIQLIMPSTVLAGGGVPPPPPPAPGVESYRWVISDLVGSGLVEIDQQGDRVRHTVYAPFGAPVEDVGDDTGRRIYAGHERHEEMGLVYMNARWYDPGAGRFMSTDPILDLRTPQSHNAYSYVVNNPINLVDPLGTDWRIVWKDEDGNTVATSDWQSGGAGESSLGQKAQNFVKSNGGVVFTGAFKGSSAAPPTAPSDSAGSNAEMGEQNDSGTSQGGGQNGTGPPGNDPLPSGVSDPPPDTRTVFDFLAKGAEVMTVWSGSSNSGATQTASNGSGGLSMSASPAPLPWSPGVPPPSVSARNAAFFSNLAPSSTMLALQGAAFLGLGLYALGVGMAVLGTGGLAVIPLGAYFYGAVVTTSAGGAIAFGGGFAAIGITNIAAAAELRRQGL